MLFAVLPGGTAAVSSPGAAVLSPSAAVLSPVAKRNKHKNSVKFITQTICFEVMVYISVGAQPFVKELAANK